MNPGRITVDHQIMGGVPCVTGTRIPAATIVGLAASGLATDEIIAGYPAANPGRRAGMPRVRSPRRR